MQLIYVLSLSVCLKIQIAPQNEQPTNEAGWQPGFEFWSLSL